MAVRDRLLLKQAGLSATKAAQALRISRQAVNKGLRNERSYFSAATLSTLANHVATHWPQDKAQLSRAIESHYAELVEHVAARTDGSTMEMALGAAERVWLVLPSYAELVGTHLQQFKTAFDALGFDTDRPDGDAPVPEVIVYCTSGKDRLEISRMISDSWFERQCVAIIKSDLVTNMMPMVIADPHDLDGPSCFVLTRNGFTALDRELGTVQMRAFATSVAQRVFEGETANDPKAAPKPFDLTRASIPQVLQVKAHLDHTNVKPLAYAGKSGRIENPDVRTEKKHAGVGG